MKLDDLIPEYGENKAKADNLKKVLEASNAEIKSIMASMLMADSKTAQYEVGNYVAKYTIQERESLDEVKLLNILKSHNLEKEGLIKVVEKIDMDVLEDMLYKDEIPHDILVEMDSCRNIKEVEVLKVSKIKKKKEDE